MGHVLGITGQMGTGKSYTAQKLSELFRANGDTLTHVSVDDSRRDILRGAKGYADLRQYLAERFLVPTFGEEKSLNIRDMAQAIFAAPDGPQIFWDIAGESIISHTQKAINAADGFVALEWARLMEDGFLPLVNGKIIIVSCDESVLMHRFKNADLPQEQIQTRLANQTKPEVLIERLAIAGIKPYILDTTRSPADREYAELYRRIRDDLARLAA